MRDLGHPAAHDRLPAPAFGLVGDIARTLRLALPIIVARTGLLVIIAVDSAMSGHASAAELAYYGIANAAQIVLVLVGVGLLQGTVILSAQAHGAGDDRACGAFWRAGLMHGLIFGLIAGLTMLAGEPFLAAIGQSPAVAHHGGAALVQFSWGFPPMMMWVATTFLLEGVSRPLPGMILMVAANLANAGLDWLFVYGHWGLPAMGAEGAVIATSIVRWLMFAGLAGYVLLMPDAQRFGVRGSWREAWHASTKLRRLGWPLGLSRGLEAAAFSVLTAIAGWLGTMPLAAFHASINLVSLVFMAAVGLSTVATVRVGNAVGRRDPVQAARAGWVAAALAAAAMLGFALLFLAVPHALARVYASEPLVLDMAAPLLVIAGLMLVPDGLQGVLMGALRGLADVWLPLVLQLSALWLLALPLAYALAFVAGLGAAGLMWGLVVGVVAAATVLAIRFHLATRREIRRF